ncbi:secretin N-terminal domain-containing protein [Rhodoferax sp.]|uniref:secretin N-terminal domain-containing protein n=1 Tax=Rhodoferax sp. TaxID=50421 RepID=UPI0027239723|nr:secretin N-terminal domain-containing protein [Rhodoferax sp.]MDO9197002.1 secretin N-terminal domain-containing protein [Rhodoferax sp.]
MKLDKTIVRLTALAAMLILSGCATNPALKESRQLLAEGRTDDSVLRLEMAIREFPDDHELRAQYFRQRDLAVGQLLAAAEAELAARHFDAAEAIYRRVQKLDANNPRVRDGLTAMVTLRRHETLVREAEALHGKGDDVATERILRAVLAENPAHGDARRLMQKLREQVARSEAPAQALKSTFNKPITLEFRDTPLKTVFEVIARSSGLNFVFDKDVKADTKVTIFVRNTGIEEVVRLILATNQLERKVLNENSVLIYPNTPAKAKDYQELVTRSFYLANADVKQAQALIRSLVKTKDIFADEKLNLLVIKDTPAAVRLAERLLESLDMAEPEVMLDVEVLEMTRSKLQELGLRFPDQIGYGLLQPTTSSTIINNGVTQTNTTLGGTLAPGFVDLRNTGGMTSFVSNPALMLNLKSQAGDGNLLANPRIRVKNREKAKIHIGDKVPVFTTTSTANVGVAASVSYLDVGLKLDVEPNVYLDDDVSIKIGLEVSSIVKEVPGPANSLAYQIGTRSASTVLRLKNGETQVLAGLISDEERSSANRLPGLGEIPLIGRLFSSQMDNSSKTEIVLLITPRIVRNLTRPQDISATTPAGSESAVGAPALQVKKAELRGLSLSSRPSGGARLPADPEPQEPPVAPVTPAEQAQAQVQAQVPAVPPAPAPVTPEKTTP